MSDFILSAGGAQKGFPIGEQKKSSKSAKNDLDMVAMPATSGQATSPKCVVENCDRLKAQHLPEQLKEVIEMTKNSQGSIPIGLLVYSAGHHENEEISTLSAMFLAAHQRSKE